jgi:hypothetical protein
LLYFIWKGPQADTPFRKSGKSKGKPESSLPLLNYIKLFYFLEKEKTYLLIVLIQDNKTIENTMQNINVINKSCFIVSEYIWNRSIGRTCGCQKRWPLRMSWISYLNTSFGKLYHTASDGFHISSKRPSKWQMIIH